MNKTVFKIIFISLIFLINLYAIDKNIEKRIDCIILEDENSIICKYTHERIQKDKMVIFNWIEPNGETTRVRSMIIPAGHGSVYDYRYVNGRAKGKWTLKVVDSNKSFETNFIIE